MKSGLYTAPGVSATARAAMTDRHEDHAVRALEQQAAGGGVVALPRDGIELELGGEARDAPQVQRKKVEEESAVGVGGEGNHAAPATLRGPAEDVLQVRRL